MRTESNSESEHDRLPDWRFQLALELLESGENPPEGLEDKVLNDAIYFLFRIAAAQHTHQTEKNSSPKEAAFFVKFMFKEHFAWLEKYLEVPPEIFRPMSAAFLIEQEFLLERYRLDLQCRILAGQTCSSIGCELDLPASAIEVFEALFFDIRDQLDAKPYLESVVFGRGYQCPQMRRLASYMQRRAYEEGLEALELAQLGLRTAHFSDRLRMRKHIAYALAEDERSERNFHKVKSQPVGQAIADCLDRYRVSLDILPILPGK